MMRIWVKFPERILKCGKYFHTRLVKQIRNSQSAIVAMPIRDIIVDRASQGFVKFLRAREIKVGMAQKFRKYVYSVIFIQQFVRKKLEKKSVV